VSLEAWRRALEEVVTVSLLDVRRLAALDMWGAAGTGRRRRLIRAEFVLGVVGCTGLGISVLATGSGWMRLLGIWFVGAGINYVPLAWEARSLSRPGALEAELRGIELRQELRHAAVQQLWIAVPLAVAVFALLDKHARR
jgi:hypothetical protein